MVVHDYLYFLSLRREHLYPGLSWEAGDWGRGGGAEAAGPWLGSCPHPGQVSLSWALALEGLQKRGDAVARHRLLGDTLFLLAWPPPRGPGLLWSSSCLLQPLTRPQSQNRGQVRVGPAVVGPQEGRAHFPRQDPEASRGRDKNPGLRVRGGAGVGECLSIQSPGGT